MSRRGRRMARASAMAVVMVAVTLAIGASAVAQQPRNTFGIVSDDEYTPDGSENQPYNGRFQFVRLSYPYSPLAGFGRAGRLAPWAHDHPRADRHYMKIMEEITLLRPRASGSNTFGVNDDALLEYPFAYMSEPGSWRPTEPEVAGFRRYLLKGGFVIFDDFRGEDWTNLRYQMSQVLPSLRFQQLTGRESVFHAFFEIPDLTVLKAPYGGFEAEYWGIFEDNDPAKRLMAVANVNNDLGEFWEYSDTGFVPVDLSNEAYKFGVNYVIYALTH